MSETSDLKAYDLEERAYQFAKKAGIYVKSLPHTMTNFEYGKQLIRASASIGANYIEANEALEIKDKLMRMKISRKESKEASFWLRLISETDSLSDMKELNTLYG